MLIKSKLKEMRLKKGITQLELSQQSGINLRMVQYYEQGYKKIEKANAITVNKLAKALECEMKDIL